LKKHRPITRISLYFELSYKFPRLKINAGCNLIFFHDIITTYNNSSEYQQAVEKACKDKEALHIQLSNVVWAVSTIAKCKYDAVRKAVFSLLVAMFSSIAFASITFILMSI